jgi:hypothetical protein
MSRMNRLTILGLGAILTVGVGLWGMASAAAQTTPQSDTGQVREITIDHPALAPNAYAGSLVLAQAGGPEVTLTIPAGTSIQRGDHHVHLEALGIGNYVTVQALPLPRQPGEPFSAGLVRPSSTGDRVGTTAGERPYTLLEASGE